MFREYARKIHHKSDPADPNFLRISVACGKVKYITIPITAQLLTSTNPDRTMV
jgi:hypothetical protein